MRESIPFASVRAKDFFHKIFAEREI